MRHREGDFDIGTRLSGICLYVTVALLRLQTLYLIAPFGILTQSVHDIEERFVIRPVFHPQDTLDRHVNTYFLEHDVYHVFAFFLGSVFPGLAQVKQCTSRPVDGGLQNLLQ